MSADNWGDCPWGDEHHPDDPQDATLREDWELGIQKGEFFVRYSGSCRYCGFEYKYKTDINVTNL